MAYTQEQLAKMLGAQKRKQFTAPVVPQVSKPVVLPKPVVKPTAVNPNVQAAQDALARTKALLTTSQPAVTPSRVTSVEQVKPYTTGPNLLTGYAQMLRTIAEKGPQQVSDPLLAGAQRGISDVFMTKKPTTPDLIYGKTYEQIQADNPKMTTAGYVGGIVAGALPSMAGGNLITSKLPAMGKGATFAAGLAADTGIDLLATAPGAISSGVTGEEYAKNAALNVGANVALAGVGALLGKAIRSIKSGAKVSDVVADIARTAPESKVSIEKELGLPEGSTWADIQRQMEQDEIVEALYQKYETMEAPPIKEQKAPFTGTEQYGVPSGKTYEQFAYEQEQARLAEEYLKSLEEGASAAEAARNVYPGKPFSGTEQYGIPEGMDYATYQRKLDEEKALDDYYRSLEQNPDQTVLPVNPRTVPSLLPKTPDATTTRIADVGVPQGVVPQAPALTNAPRGIVPPPRIPVLPNIERELFPSTVRQPSPTPKMPEPAIITAQKRAQQAVRPIGSELPLNATQANVTPSVAQRMEQAPPDLAMAPRVTPKVEPVVGGPQTRTAKQQIDIDVITEPGTRERGLSKNVATDLNRPQQTIDSFNDDPVFYEKLSNKTTLEKAQSILDKGYDNALKEYDNMGRTFEAHKVPLGIKLSDEAVARGDFDTSRRILADLAEELTSAGQFSQAANILRRSNDPEAATLFIQRQITKLNKDGAEQYGKKWNPVNLTDEELQAIKASAGDQAKYDATMEQIYNRIAKQIPSSNREKFDAWRRMAMLMNPKTHVRNIVGNTLMKGLEKTSDTIANAIEAIVKPAERTKAIGWSSDKGLVKTVKDSWETVKNDLTNASKYEISGLKAFNREKPIFKTKAIEFMNNLSKSTLEAEDVFFMKGAYQDALGQYMKANKLTTPNANAIEYAKNKAMEATFRSANALSNFIEGIKRKKGVAGVVAEAAIPFSKTPANILMRGIDYSPFGLIKLLASKDKTPAEIIDVIAKGATGSSLVGLGMLLADAGWARGDYTTAKKEGLAELTGEQPMSIITPQGSYTFDWAQPAAVPLAMGIAIQENLKRKNPDAAKIAIEAAAAGGDAIINMSMLQNLKDLMGGGFESPTENILSLPKQYVEQAFPSVVGQFARISDPKQRSSYADTEIQKALNQIKAKTPGKRQTLEPKVDILGREVSAGTLPTRIVQNLLSPGSIKKKDTEPVVVELSRLYESGRDTRIIPRVAPKTLERTVDGKKEELKLSAEQLTKFQKSMGNANADDLRRLFGSIAYQNADDAKKSKLVKNIVEDNYEEEKEKAFKSGSFY